LTDEDRWRRAEPPASGPSAPHKLEFDPLATGIGVFSGVTIPAIVIVWGFEGNPGAVFIVGAIVAGLLAGVFAGAWVMRRDGRIWRGPRA
jgi:hypothetical protein